MNIWLPIVLNLIPVLVVSLALTVGLKNGFKVELLKLLLIAGALVGCYFLTPVLYNLVAKIKFIADNLIYLQPETIKSFVFTLTFLVLYLIIVIICFFVKKFSLFERIKHLNKAKIGKVRGTSRRETKKLRREQKQFRKSYITKKHIGVVSRVFSAIFGLLVGILISATLLLLVKYTLKEIHMHNEQLEHIERSYEYTPYGQVDKLIDYSDFIVKK